MPKPVRDTRKISVRALPYPDIWPLIAYSSELHSLVESLANPRNWDGGEYQCGDIPSLAKAALQKAPDRPQGESIPIQWLSLACDNGHSWIGVMAWQPESGGWKLMGEKNRAGRPLCPNCGAIDSPKARKRLIKS